MNGVAILVVEYRRAGDHTPAALLTAREEVDLPTRAAAHGAGVLAKPFAYVDLLACVDRLTASAETTRSGG